MTYAEELFADVMQVLRSVDPIPSRYLSLGQILDRMLKERTQKDDVEYEGLVPRIYALSQRYQTSQQPLCILYSNIVRIRKDEYKPEEEDLLYDVKALCQAISAFYETPAPQAILQYLPATWRSWNSGSGYSDVCIRIVVKEWDEHFIWGYQPEDETQKLLKVAYGYEWALAGQLYPLASLNLLDAIEDENGTLHPRLFVLSPDYLIDITSVCQCVKESGASPYFYLLEKFLPREETLAIQLGNAANQFLDDSINEGAPFLRSMQKSFKDYPLRYCTLSGVDENFFRQCQQQHANITAVVGKHFREAGIDVEKDAVQLEPSFICDKLGLQGRMDLVTGDLTKIVELKSGKQDEFHGTYRLEHAMQMALYKEILHYSLGLSRGEVKTLLLYSKYPILHDIRLGGDYIVKALALRNGIVHIDRQLRTNAHDFLRNLREEYFNPQDSRGRLYLNYIKPRVEKFLLTIASATPLEYDYFCTMVSFTQREQFLAKVGDDRPGSDRGFAQAWLCDTETKRQHGNIISGLRLAPVVDGNGVLTHVKAKMKADHLSQPNFREGDSVILYERNTETDLMTNRQSLRCYVEEMHPDRLLFRFSHPQRGTTGLHLDSHYAVEPAHSDALFSSLYRGLYALLTCPLSRRNLVLGLRQPERDTSIVLKHKVESKEIENILHDVLQSQDYYLLIGPPGSGKTNIALKSMVEELLSQNDEDCILLMAYTNRAVDEICQMLESIPTAPGYLRMGQELSCATAYRPRLIRNVIADCCNRVEIMEHIRPIRIFCGTVATLCGNPELFELKHFRTAILDEASQVLEPQLLPLLTRTSRNGSLSIGRFVLIGDHKQLPAVVVQHQRQSRVESERLCEMGLQNCRDSFFERLSRITPAQFAGMLTKQGRMHQEINDFVCTRYYQGALDTVPLHHQTETCAWPAFDPENSRQEYMARHRLGVCNVLPAHPLSNNKVNPDEAREVALMVSELYQLTCINHQSWNPKTQVGIIVPFRGQIAMVRQALHQLVIPECNEVTIDTVERYQGSQRDVIIFSTVVSRHYQLEMLSDPVESEGLSIDRKLNVAITRSRKQFFLVGNLPLLRQAPDYRCLIEHALNA